MTVVFSENGTNYSNDPNEVETISKYTDYLRFPHYYCYASDDEDTQGQWVLSDATSCKVTWNYNQIPTLQMNYPRDGFAAKIIKPEGIILSDVNRILVHQKFRVKEVEKDQDQLVINATHIIGDIAGLTLAKSIQMPDASAADFYNALMNNATSWIPELRFDTDVSALSNVNVDMTSGNLSNYIFDTDAEGDEPTQSLLGLYHGEIVPDNYQLGFYQHAGHKTNIVVRYGRNIQTIQQDKNIEGTYTAIYPYVTYNAGQARATETNVDWANWVTDWSGVATVTYSAGGSIDVYDSPVQGHNVIGHLTTGQSLKVGMAVQDGSYTPDHKFEIDTVNGTTYYPVLSDSNGLTVTGWVSANWINFSKKGDYLINKADGYVHTAIKEDDSKTTYVAVRGTGTVNYKSGGKAIHFFNHPAVSSGTRKWHGKAKIKDGTRFTYIGKAIDNNGTTWYELHSMVWLFGPHVKVNSEQDITRYPSNAYGKIKKGATAYHKDKNGMFVPKTHNGKLHSSRRHKKPKRVRVRRGRGKKRHWVWKKTYTYGKARKWHTKVRTKIKPGYAHLNKGQYVVGNTIYYKVSNGTYVKGSSIDWNAPRSNKGKTPSDLDKNRISKRGEVIMYSGPNSGKLVGYAKVGQGFKVEHMGTDAAGNTWYEIDANGQVGWIQAELTDTSDVGDKEPSAPEDDQDNDDDTDAGTDTSTNVDQSTVQVTLGDGPDGLVYPDNFPDSEAPRILNVDLSSDFKHDDTDTSGLQPDGSWKETAADQDQLRSLAIAYVQEHQIGVIPVSTTVQYAQFGGIEGDISEVNMYDQVTVDFEKLGIQETSEVSATVYDALNHHYDQVTIGDLPRTWQHELLAAAQKQTDDLKQGVRDSFKETGHLFQDMKIALKEEGQDRKDQDLKIAKEVGLVDEKTGQLNISMKQLDSKITDISGDVSNISSEILNGGSSVLQFYPNFLNPTEIKAVNDDGTYLVLNSSGLGYFDSGTNTVRSAISSNGQIAAELIDGGTIKALHMESGEFSGAMTTDDGTIKISIGTNQGSSPLSPTYGGRGIWVDADNGAYHSLMSSGKFETTNGNQIWNFGANGISVSDNGGLSWQRLHRTIKVGKERINLFYGV